MRKLLATASVILLSGCAGDCVDTYYDYLARTTCTSSVISDCKKQSVINSAKEIERSFYFATKDYKAAYDKDAVTTEIATKYVTSKNAFCEFVNNIED